jgi:hypothetical protein
MDLKTFVAQTLIQIVEGVADAKAAIEAGETNARVNPKTVYGDKAAAGDPHPVEFDVALTVTSESKESSGAKAGASAGILAVVSARVAGELSSSSIGAERNESVSRVRFTVQLAQPSAIENRPSPGITPMRRDFP